MGPTAARRGASNRAARCRQQPPTRRRKRSRRAGTITRASLRPRRTSEVASRGRRAQLGAVGGAGGQAPSGLCDPCGRIVWHPSQARHRIGSAPENYGKRPRAKHRRAPSHAQCAGRQDTCLDSISNDHSSITAKAWYARTHTAGRLLGGRHGANTRTGTAVGSCKPSVLWSEPVG